MADEVVIWGDFATEHMLTRHRVTVDETAEALADPGAIWADPTPAAPPARWPASSAGHTPGSNSSR